MAKLVGAALYLYLFLFLLLLHLHCHQCKPAAAAASFVHGSGGGGATTTKAAAAVRAVFVFGSSLVDNGNNNHLNGSGAVRADYAPYGVDFPLGATGRFSNGRNVIDALGELLRLPAAGLLPPFADPATRGRAALHGVNFASGGSGILDLTGKNKVSALLLALIYIFRPSQNIR